MKNLHFKPSAVLFAILLCVSAYDVSAKVKPDPKTSSAARPKVVLSPKALASMKLSNVEFAFNKATLAPSSYTTLNKVATLMIDNDAALKLGGHADNRGGYVYNWKLSKSRADAVKDYLVKKGANSSRIASTEYGFTKPIASNKTSNGRHKNRRVELKFVE